MDFRCNAARPSQKRHRAHDTTTFGDAPDRQRAHRKRTTTRSVVAADSRTGLLTACCQQFDGGTGPGADAS
jgi:hypothetical protein